MNSLPFFPPPSRSLSRLNDKPPPSPSLSRVNTQSNRPFSSSNRNSPSRGGHTSSSSASEGNGSQSTSATSSNTGKDRSQARKGTLLESSTPDSSRNAPMNDGVSELSKSATQRPSSSGSSTPVSTTGGRLGTRLPAGMYFDLLRPNEVSAAFKMEVKGYSKEDAATLDTLRYRQKEAPHLFFGAFIPMALPKVSGPLTLAGPTPRKLIAFACGTAASALTARSMKIHSHDEDAWLVCLHSVCVSPEYQRKGVALKLIEEYMKRLRKAEQGLGGPNLPKKGYECVALLAHEELFPLYIKAGFRVLGVSHVNWGSGGWFEMRRYINPEQQEDADGKGLKRSSSSSALADGVQKAFSPDLIPIHSDPLAATLPDALVGSPELAASPASELDTKVNDESREEKLEGKENDRNEHGEETSTKDTLSPDGKEDLGPLGGITSAQLLEALKNQTTASKSAENGPINPGTAYATIVGQTLAAKTTVEDAFFALEARLVERESGTNLAEIYCPREECSCMLLRAKEADWEVAELGPLASANLSLPNSPPPPSAPVPPPPSSLDRIRGALGQKNTGNATTPVRTFWCVYSPMAFENIGFSKDDDWVPPTAISPTEKIEPKRPEVRKKPTKRGSIFRRNSEKKRDEKEKMSPLEKETSPGSTAAACLEDGSSTLASPVPSEPVKVKYLLCADCDCGPLGYTVLLASMQGGKFAQEVGKTIDGQATEAQQEPPVYLIAADRVRYRFVKSC